MRCLLRLRSSVPLAVVGVGIILAGCGGPRPTEADRGTTAQQAAVPDTGYADGPVLRGGTGRYYMGRPVAQVMGHEGAVWLERPERAETELPGRVVEALGLEPDDVVADLGAGTGYFTLRLAERVPQGRVYAVDVQPEMLAMLEGRLAAAGVRNVVPVLGNTADPRLPAASVDLVLMVDAYHEFAYPREMLAAIREALVPGGRVVLIEYRAEDAGLPIHPLHRMSEAQARRELEAAGFSWVETRDFLPHQHFLVFERPE